MPTALIFRLIVQAASARRFARLKATAIIGNGFFSTVAALLITTAAHAVTIDWVTVGDPGNTADDTVFGAVAEEFRIGKYEVTIQQYADFLNAVAESDTYGLYNTSMGIKLNVAGITRSGTSGAYTYHVMDNGGYSGNRPVTFVSWFDAARFANWMHNGQGSGSTETGAYTLNGAVSGVAPAKNSNAQYFIPTENQWYKAAYFKGGQVDAGYWDYAVQLDAPAQLSNKIGSDPGQANFYEGGYSVTQSQIYSASQNYLTDVGAFTGSPSAYGTFDQTGNVWEWNDLAGVADASRGLRGGFWRVSDPFGLSADSRFTLPASYEDQIDSEVIGFRLASPVPSATPLILFVNEGIQTQGQLGHPLLSAATPLVKSGAGTLVLDVANTFSSALTINEGTVVAAHVRAIGSGALNVAGGASLDISGALGPLNPMQIEQFGSISGRVDVGTGRFILRSPITTGDSVEDLLLSGRNGGTWDGAAGITSSTVPSEAAIGVVRSVGWKRNPDGSITVAYAAPGDVNLDGEVNVFDMVDVSSSGKYGEGTVSVWSQGDFDYNGVTNIFDMVLVNGAGVYGAGNYLPEPSAAASVAAVPEPSLGLVVLAGMACGVYAGRRGSQRRVLSRYQRG